MSPLDYFFKTINNLKSKSQNTCRIQGKKVKIFLPVMAYLLSDVFRRLNQNKYLDHLKCRYIYCINNSLGVIITVNSTHTHILNIRIKNNAHLLTMTVFSLSVTLPVTVPIPIPVSLPLSASLSVIIIMTISTPRFMTPTLFP